MYWLSHLFERRLSSFHTILHVLFPPLRNHLDPLTSVDYATAAMRDSTVMRDSTAIRDFTVMRDFAVMRDFTVLGILYCHGRLHCNGRLYSHERLYCDERLYCHERLYCLITRLYQNLPCVHVLTANSSVTISSRRYLSSILLYGRRTQRLTKLTSYPGRLRAYTVSTDREFASHKRQRYLSTILLYD